MAYYSCCCRKIDPKKRVYDQHHPFLTDIEDLRELSQPGYTDRGCIHVDVKLPKVKRMERFVVVVS